MVPVRIKSLHCLLKENYRHRWRRLPRLTIHARLPRRVRKGPSPEPRQLPGDLRRSHAPQLTKLQVEKKTQSYTCPDPSRVTSPMHNNGPPANPVKRASTGQPSPNASLELQLQLQLNQLLQGPPGEISNDFSAIDSAGSLSFPNCEGLSRFQCEHCGMKLSSRNCLYKQKQRKHKTIDKVDKATGSKHVICPECKE